MVSGKDHTDKISMWLKDKPQFWFIRFYQIYQILIPAIFVLWVAPVL